MILYGSPISPFVRKVLVYVDVKGIELELVPVGIGDSNPDFMLCSPFKKMPGFRDGDFTISDSTAIIAYLEAKFPDRVMVPADPADRARTVWFEEFADTILVAAAGAIFFNRVVAPKFLGREGDMEAADKAEKEALPPVLDYLEGAIGNSDYLVGGQLTLADIAVASPFVNLIHVGIIPDAAKYPNITRWLSQIHALEGFAIWIRREKKMLGNV